MARKQRVFFIKLSYILIDVFYIMLSIFLACLLRKDLIDFPLTMRALFFSAKNPFQVIFIFWILTTVFLNHAHGLYQTRRERWESVEIWNVIKCVLYSTVLTIVLIYILKIDHFPRSILMFTAVFMAIFLSIWRFFKRLFVEFLVAHGYNNFNVLIVGAGKVGCVLSQEIEKHPTLGLKAVGFLDDFKSGTPPGTLTPILGTLADFESITRREFIHKVFITIHHSNVFLHIMEKAREMRIAIHVIPHGFEYMTGEFANYNIGMIPILEYCDEEHIIKQAGKRLFDFALTSAALILLSPVFLVLAVLITFDSPGPIFYKSRRYGMRGRMFNMYKFRSMVVDAEKEMPRLREKSEVDGPIFKMKEDPRVTRFGKFLRRYSLDELPQLFNVLRGEMSLVGPRPLPIDQIEKEDLRQLKRLDVRPGITGLWQIRGRSDISFSRLVKWDVWYINNWSFWLDLKVLYQTIPVVLKGKGAY